MQDIVGGAGPLNQLMGEILTTTQEQEKGLLSITHALAELEQLPRATPFWWMNLLTLRIF